VNNWIKVEDELPRCGLPCALYTGEGVHCTGGDSVNNWIKVEDRPPPDVGMSVDYLVCLANGDMTVAAWMAVGGWGFNPESPIVYWMKLPDPPKALEVIP